MPIHQGVDMTCRECKDKLYPDSPSQPFFIRGRYHKPLCYYCPGFEGTHPIELTPEPQWTKRQWYQVDQLKGEVRHYQNKVIELLEKQKSLPKRKMVSKYD